MKHPEKEKVHSSFIGLQRWRRGEIKGRKQVHLLDVSRNRLSLQNCLLAIGLTSSNCAVIVSGKSLTKINGHTFFSTGPSWRMPCQQMSRDYPVPMERHRLCLCLWVCFTHSRMPDISERGLLWWNAWMSGSHQQASARRTSSLWQWLLLHLTRLLMLYDVASSAYPLCVLCEYVRLLTNTYTVCLLKPFSFSLLGHWKSDDLLFEFIHLFFETVHLYLCWLRYYSHPCWIIYTLEFVWVCLYTHCLFPSSSGCLLFFLSVIVFAPCHLPHVLIKTNSKMYWEVKECLVNSPCTWKSICAQILHKLFVSMPPTNLLTFCFTQLRMQMILVWRWTQR